MSNKIQTLRLNAAMRDLLNDANIRPNGDAKDALSKTDRIVFSENLKVSCWTRHFMREPGTMVIGSLGYMSYAHSPAHQFSTGAFCSTAAGITVMGDRHPVDRVSTHPLSYGAFYQAAARTLGAHDVAMHTPYDRGQPRTIIQDDVWIGARVTLGGGIRVGTGAILATGSIVTKNVPPYAIVGGVPGRIIKYRFSEGTIANLLETRWWDYSLKDLAQFDFQDPDRFCDDFLARRDALRPRANGEIRAADLLALA